MKLAEALTLTRKTPADSKAFSVLLACGFSPLHLQTFLAAHLQERLNRKIQISTGLYGSLVETLDELPNFKGEAAALFIEWSDLDARLGYRSLGGWGSSVLGSVDGTLGRLLNLLRNKPASLPLLISIPTLTLPPGFHTIGWQASAAEVTLESQVFEFAQKAALLPAVVILNRQKLALLSNQSERYDFRSDLSSGFPYSIKHSDILAEAAAELLAPSAPKKGLITDLDDTMWRGIVGEDGPEAVAWDLASHAQLHGLYQQMLGSLADQGVLIGVASKNNVETAEKALQRSDFVLKRKNIFPAEIHWDAKSGSVSRILKTWNIAADSVVFVDDSAMELEEVRTAHPGIECILFPKNDYAGTFSLLQRLRDLFGKPALSNEDSFRLESIRNSQTFLDTATNVELAEQFLSSAEATVTFEWPPKPDDTRILELVNKTNQFNLNGTRFTPAEWHQLTCAPGAFVAAVSYQDKFGPLGKIAVLCGQKDSSMVEIKVWVMSCRAFSRRIEHQILKQVFEKTEMKNIRFAYRETTKNSPTRDFLESILGNDPHLALDDFKTRCPALYHQVEFKEA